MSTTTPSTTATPASTSSSAAASSSSSPSLVFPQAGEMFTCGVTLIHWTYTGPSASLSLNISNINVAQQAPLTPSPAPTSTTTNSSSSTSPSASQASTSASAALTRRQYNGYGGSYLPPINVVLATGLNASADVWQWDAVNVPQGWYQILGDVQGVIQTSSSEFFVGNGSSTDCIKQFATASTPVSNPSSSSSGAGSTAVAESSSHSNAGAIAGGVIGGIIFLAAAFLAFFYFCLGRRSSRSRLHDDYDGGRRWSQLSFKKLRSGGDVRSSIQQHHANMPTLDANQTFVGTDEELSTIAHEKAIAAAVPPTSFQPVRTRSHRGSTQTNASSSNAAFHTESPVRRTPSYQAQQVESIPLERTQSGQNHGYPPSPSEPPVSRSATYNATPGAVTLERTPTGGGGPRRKPAPRYDDAAEAEAERERNVSSQATPSSSLGTANGGDSVGDHQILRHQNSFGAMRPMHVMMPDLPPVVHN